MTTIYTTLPSPIGELLITGNGDAITALHMGWSGQPAEGWVREDRALREARRQMEAYFAGELTEFDLPLAARGTPFQEKVWAALRTVPYGATTSYGDIAGRIGQPTAVRAVGAANGRNPIAIIVPCHRVIGSNGSLTGYGGGVERKRWLLDHEARVAARLGLAAPAAAGAAAPEAAALV